MQISLIAALSENGVIGKDNKLPWHLPEDLKYFRKMTLGKPVIMGRKTFESMGSRPLPNRTNIILTNDHGFKTEHENCIVVQSKEAAMQAAKQALAFSSTAADTKAKIMEEIMIIGGESIFKLFLPIATRLYLTFVHQKVLGDTFFPAVNWPQWQEISAEKHAGFTFTVYDRISDK